MTKKQKYKEYIKRVEKYEFYRDSIETGIHRDYKLAYLVVNGKCNGYFFAYDNYRGFNSYVNRIKIND